MKNKVTLSLKHQKIISIVSVIIFLLFCAAISWFVGRPMIKLVSQPDIFRQWINSKGLFGKLAFIGMMVMQVVIALIPGEPLEIGAGYAFGGLEGTILCIIGTTLGSVIVFLLVRKFGIKLVEVFFKNKEIKRLKFLNDKRKRGIIIFLVFFLPGTPKDLITYFVGLTDISIKHFLLLASIARQPSVITSTIGGGALGVKEYKSAIIIFIIALIISALGLLTYRIVLNIKNHR